MSTSNEEISEDRKEIQSWSLTDRWYGPRNQQGRPAVISSFKKTMSWKRHGEDGSRGVAYFELYFQPCGTCSILAKELPESGRGSKEVMIDLCDEKAIELRDLLLAAYPLTK